MIKKFSISMASLAALALTLSGCAGEPYVQNTSEFNRKSPSFAKGPVRQQNSAIFVCYAKGSATPAQIRQLAEDECGRFDLGATYFGQTYELCPLTTPIAAGFTCTAQAAVQATPQAAPEAAPSTAPNRTVAAPVAVPRPIFPKLEAQKPAGAGRQLSVPQAGIAAGDVSTDAKSQPFPTFLFDKTERTVDPQ